MHKQIHSLLAQGYSRNDIFEELKGQSSNEARLAQQVATVLDRKVSGLSTWLNGALLVSALMQSGVAIFSVYKGSLPIDKGFSDLAITLLLILTVIYLIGLARKSFTGYASFMMFSVVVAGHYIYVFNVMPMVASQGVALALLNGGLACYVKMRVFPHMGVMDIRKDDEGNYILE